jgi:hypothetical protein
MEKLKEMVKQNVQDELKQYNDTKNKKNWEDKKNQLNEIRGDFNKLQSETMETIKKENND